MNAGQIVAEGRPGELKRMAGRELAKLKSIPGDYTRLEPLLKRIKGIESVTVTEHGIVVEADDISPKVPEITKAFGKRNEKIVEFSVSKPSLEDVFLKLTGAQLKGVAKIEVKK